MTDPIQRQGNDSNEAELIEKAKQGDAQAFQALYDKHKRRVYSLCLRMTANTAEAEDLTQEAFLQLYRKIATFRGESAFSTWLHRLSVNVVLMHLRRKSLPVVSLEETTQGGEEDTPKKDFGAEDLALAGSIDRLQLQRAVDNLPPGYRTIFVLHDVEGYEHNEIATDRGLLDRQQQVAVAQSAHETTRSAQNEASRKGFLSSSLEAVKASKLVRYRTSTDWTELAEPQADLKLAVH